MGGSFGGRRAAATATAAPRAIVPEETLQAGEWVDDFGWTPHTQAPVNDWVDQIGDVYQLGDIEGTDDTDGAKEHSILNDTVASPEIVGAAAERVPAAPEVHAKAAATRAKPVRHAVHVLSAQAVIQARGVDVIHGVV